MTQAQTQSTASPEQPAYRKKLIEVALPLEAINAASAKEKSIRHGHPSTLHLWWARRPLAACRAVLFGQLVDDPSSVPEEFPTEEKQVAERERLFRIIEDLVQWKNSNDEEILYRARMEIARSVARNKGIPFKRMSKQEVLVFLAEHAPPVLDPFCGGGSIPLEAQRLGLRAYGSDLNPVAVLITKALIEIPPKFAGRPPVNPGQQSKDPKNVNAKAQTQNRFDAGGGQWKGARGLAEDVRYYGKWMRDEAEDRIGHLYPKVKLPKENGGGEAAVIAWLWARTVKCPNPACGAEMPLVRNFQLSSKKGKEAWANPKADGGAVRFRIGDTNSHVDPGTVTRAGASCLACGQLAPLPYVRDEGMNGRMSAQVMAVVAEGSRQRIYLPPDADTSPPLDGESEKRVEEARGGFLSSPTPQRLTGGTCYGYGLTSWGKLFTPRQLVALTTFSDLVQEARERVLHDAQAAGMPPGPGIEDGGDGGEAYADAVATYLAFVVSRMADRHSSLTRWDPNPSGYAPKIANTFGRQALPMVWDFTEGNPFSNSTGNLEEASNWVAKVVDNSPACQKGRAVQGDATIGNYPVTRMVVATDPPYYDNIGYADLSDFFYVWLRRSLQGAYPALMSTIATPKTPELIASPHRHEGGKDAAKAFFEKGFFETFGHVRKQAAPGEAVSIFYAFKQAEAEVIGDEGMVSSTGWETFLSGLMRAGFAIDGTWPNRSELANRMIASGTNALASSIIMVCRPRPDDAISGTRRDFQTALRTDLRPALKRLQQGNIAPVDLPQAAIGPGMAVFSRYKEVLVPDGSGGTRPMTVREALQLINQVLDEFLSETEGDLDAETRVAVSWFEQRGFKEGPFGELEGLLKARNTATNAMVEAGILKAHGGKASLIPREELPKDWDPATDPRLTVWECLQHAIRVYRAEGSEACGALVAKMRGKSEDVRALAYRLYTVCERKKWADEARAYNELIADWLHVQAAAHRASSEWKGPLDQFGGGS
jgi:putative DNA methylase